jgi:hypothetical protein
MEEVQKTLEEILAKLAAVTTEVNATSEEVHGFRKQMEDYGTDLDGVKHRVQEANRQGHPSQLEVPLQNKGALTNHGAPLLGSVPDGPPNFRTAPSSPQNPAEQHGRQEQNGHQILSHADRHAPDQGDLRVRAPRHDFPKFSGEMPLLWIDQSTNYFEMFKIPPHQWVGIAMLYLEGHAALWYQAFKRRYTQVTWEIFTAAVIEEFDQNEYDGQMNKLMQLKKTGTVAKYRLAFEECMYHLISLDESLSSRWFVSKFVFGLRDDIRVAVRLQAPPSITRATALARIQEEEQEFNRPRQRPAAPTKHPPAPVPGSQTATAARTDWPRKQGTDDFNREHELRDFRRPNNLCFKCGDKYNKEHQCKRSNQLLTIEVGEFGEVLSDEACLAMELLQETPTAGTCCHISQAALAGSEAPNSMRIRATVGDQVMILLIDSGSSHTFVTKFFAERAGCQLSPASAVSVKIANGQLMQSQSQVLGLNWCYEGHIFSDNMRVLEIGGYDAILGMDWLDSCSPMYCHWAQKVLRFAHNGEVVTLKGMVSPARIAGIVSGTIAMSTGY